MNVCMYGGLYIYVRMEMHCLCILVLLSTFHNPSIHPYCICSTKNSINVYIILFLIVLFIFLQISTAFIVGSIKSYLILNILKRLGFKGLTCF